MSPGATFKSAQMHQLSGLTARLAARLNIAIRQRAKVRTARDSSDSLGDFVAAEALSEDARVQFPSSMVASRRLTHRRTVKTVNLSAEFAPLRLNQAKSTAAADTDAVVAIAPAGRFFYLAL